MKKITLRFVIAAAALFMLNACTDAETSSPAAVTSTETTSTESGSAESGNAGSGGTEPLIEPGTETSTTTNSGPASKSATETDTTAPSTAVPAPVVVEPVTPLGAIEASRLLQQASFGPRWEDVAAVQDLSVEQWLDEQFALPPTLHRELIRPDDDGDSYHQVHRVEAWLRASMHAPDQLRQRVAFALSEIFVISDRSGAIDHHAIGMVNYYDMLIEGAFGNYRDLLESVTLHPMMGRYLSHLGNRKADAASNIRPDENYAREVMQLFSVGLVQLDIDGTVRLDSNGEPMLTYDQETVENFARVFTGWNFADASYWDNPDETASQPMEAWEWFHDKDPKTLLSGVQIPGGQSAAEDLRDALDNLFYHVNVGPFISKQLIQRLVTSNPSPEYIARVAGVFNDNGNQERGDLKAVVRAILSDIEAREGHLSGDSFGKVREPLIQLVHMWRLFEGESASQRIIDWQLARDFGQGPLQAPSVFNFFRPDFMPSSLHDLAAPELQLWTDANILSLFNEWVLKVLWSVSETREDPDEDHMLVRMAPWVSVLEEQGAVAFVERLDLLMLGGTMSPSVRTASLEALAELDDRDSTTQVVNMILMMLMSPQYAVQR